MSDIFDMTDEAFEPFYDTPVAFRGVRPGSRPVEVVVNCCIHENIDESGPLLEEDADTTVRHHRLSFPASAWTHETPPRRGDVATIGNVRYSVYHVIAPIDDNHGHEYYVDVKEGA